MVGGEIVKSLERHSLAACVWVTVIGGKMEEMRGVFVCFFFNDTATTEIYTLSLHDALPILVRTDSTNILCWG